MGVPTGREFAHRRGIARVRARFDGGFRGSPVVEMFLPARFIPFSLRFVQLKHGFSERLIADFFLTAFFGPSLSPLFFYLRDFFVLAALVGPNITVGAREGLKIIQSVLCIDIGELRAIFWIRRGLAGIDVRRRDFGVVSIDETFVISFGARLVGIAARISACAVV